MPFTISTQPHKHSFSASSDQNILEAALDAGLELPHGCRYGACGACKTKVINGQIDHKDSPASTLPQSERDAGYALLCLAHACSDLTLEIKSGTPRDDFPAKQFPCRVQSLKQVAPDVVILKLKLSDSEILHFRAGQYIDFLLPNNHRRSFSIANAPHVDDHIELHIRRISGGTFTRHVFEGMQTRDILRLEGPLGSFSLQESSERPIILLAGGTGFAPVKSIVEHIIHQDIQRPITLYWGALTREGLYMDALARQWAKARPDFHYIPVLSDALSTDEWQGRTGFVHHALMADLPNLSKHDVYACGSPAMVEAAKQDLTQKCHLPEEAFFADAFTYAAP